jgi:hypothetical protein
MTRTFFFRFSISSCSIPYIRYCRADQILIIRSASEFEKSTEYDKVNLGATPTPKTAKEDISLPSVIDTVRRLHSTTLMTRTFFFRFSISSCSIPYIRYCRADPTESSQKV